MKRPIETSVASLRRLTHELTTERPDTWSFLVTGPVFTCHGLVWAYSCALKGRLVSVLTFVWRGKTYRRRDERAYSERGLAILAGRFARDVTSGQVKG